MTTATFPVTAQYPATRSTRFSNQAVRFVDGSEQRYRDSGGALHRWEIALDLLDELELAAVEEFYRSAGGRYETFLFTDPWDGTEYPECGLASDDLGLAVHGEKRGGTVLVVAERRP